MSRLSPDRREELYVGTLALVAEYGYDKLTMDQIAHATRSSKATLYRQWGGKAELVVEAIRCLGEMETELPDTGSLRGDLHAMITQHDDQDKDSELMTAILHAMRQNAELADAVRAQIMEPAWERVGLLIQRASERGEIDPDCPALDFTGLLLMAPVVLLHPLEGRDPDPAYMTHYVDSVLLPALGIN